jgi:hypothetical protein
MKTKTVVPRIAAIAMLGLGISAARSFATEFSFSGSGTDNDSGNSLSALATFNITGNDLKITLQNNGAAATQPGDVLTILYFNINGTPNLKPDSATLGSGSSLIHPGLDPGSIGGNWEYKNVSGPNGATAGISTTGIGQFGPSGNFGSPAHVGGVSFGIVNGLGANPNGGMDHTLINDSIIFDMTLPTGFDVTSITDVGFQYGTSSGEAFVPSTPPVRTVPDGGSTVILLGAALAGIALYGAKSRTSSAQP